jgi:hypothetical protein
MRKVHINTGREKPLRVTALFFYVKFPKWHHNFTKSGAWVPYACSYKKFMSTISGNECMNEYYFSQNT